MVGCTAEDMFSKAKGWFKNQAEKELRNDAFKRSDYLATIIGIVAGVGILAFFAYHLMKPTGFFTSAFGSSGALLFFSVALFGFIPQVVRLITRRKTPAKLFELASSMLVLIALIYFLATFPFDFQRFATPLPQSIEFLLSWVSNGVATVLMILGVIGLCFAIPIQLLQWVHIRRIAREPKGESPASAQATVADEPPKNTA